tara:strand:+ start:270 stop:704 length:435 start_codon:yes stop_codon:yes gene_type:complete
MKINYQGFTLIELLVVVAIIGILSAVGIQAYNGYTSGTKKKSAENIMQQIVLGQTEYYSTTGVYYETGDCASSYDASTTTSQKIEDDLLDGSNIIDDDAGISFCIEKHSTLDYRIKATHENRKCWKILDGRGNWNPSSGWGNCE